MPGSIPKDKYININTVCNDIDLCIDNFLNDLNIDRDYKSITSIKHQTINFLFRYIYQTLFKTDKTLCNNQNSLVDYNNIELLKVLADKFIDICLYFNKSFGLMSFCYMIGCDYSTVYRWLQDRESNPDRCKILENIQETHKAAQIALLNDSPVGALAVANNDKETGLNWSANQAATITNNTVYYLPSERAGRLKLDQPAD